MGFLNFVDISGNTTSQLRFNGECTPNDIGSCIDFQEKYAREHPVVKKEEVNDK